MRSSGLAISAAIVLFSAHAAARKPKRHFEPDDLSLEDPGVMEVDLQFGPVRGPDAWRLVAPDVEIDVGLTPEVEFDIDGAYAREAQPDGAFKLDHDAPDNLWISMKLGLYDDHNEATHTAFAVGLQLGPKLPVAPDARGLGYEAMGLVGWTWPRAQLVLQAGGVIDPGTAIGSGRPIGIEAGADLEVFLERTKKLGMTAELGGVFYLTGDPVELTATWGPEWLPNEGLTLSIVGLVGLPPGSDRYGVLFGVAQKMDLAK